MVSSGPAPDESPRLTVTNRSGGANINASEVFVSGDVVGRDKIVLNFQATQPSHFESRSDIPFPRNPHFVGREDDLERLHAALQG